MNQKNDALNRQIEYLVANLLDFFRDPRRELRYIEAAKIAINQVSRIDLKKASRLEKRFFFFTGRLKNNVNPSSIRHFAHECFQSAEKILALTKSTEDICAPNLQTLHKKAQKELSNSLAGGHSEGAALHRAANELLKEKRQRENALRLFNMAKSHPLRETLLVTQSSQRAFAKEDVRHHFLRLKRTRPEEKKGDGVLFGLLEKAQAFSAQRLHHLLGDELFFLCRPLGFLDQNSSNLLVEVPSAAHLHALTYRKLEILRALKRDNVFSAIKYLRFRISKEAL